LPRDAEASNVLVGEVDFLESPFVAFVRLQQAVMLGALTEVPVPTRYSAVKLLLLLSTDVARKHDMEEEVTKLERSFSAQEGNGNFSYIVTVGAGQVNVKTSYGVLESFLGTALTGAVFCLLAGQPLTILSSTGPVLVFERLLFSFSKDNGFDYLEFRLWIGLWSGLFCLVLVATDASFLVQYFTRFTEEGFSALISFIFIYDAFKKMIKLAHHNPINSEFDHNLITHYDCRCVPGAYLTAFTAAD
ncbi:hypothetical protein XENOCAPTIV_013901, partial [Xenoophorus captivus]